MKVANTTFLNAKVVVSVIFNLCDIGAFVDLQKLANAVHHTEVRHFQTALVIHLAFLVLTFKPASFPIAHEELRSDHLYFGIPDAGVNGFWEVVLAKLHFLFFRIEGRDIVHAPCQKEAKQQNFEQHLCSSTFFTQLIFLVS